MQTEFTPEWGQRERADLAEELFAKAQAADPKGGAALVAKARNDLGLK